jgi:hypothetical protein
MYKQGPSEAVKHHERLKLETLTRREAQRRKKYTSKFKLYQSLINQYSEGLWTGTLPLPDPIFHYPWKLHDLRN